jgi:hypothetical protein
MATSNFFLIVFVFVFLQEIRPLKKKKNRKKKKKQRERNRSSELLTLACWKRMQQEIDTVSDRCASAINTILDELMRREIKEVERAVFRHTAPLVAELERLEAQKDLHHARQQVRLRYGKPNQTMDSDSDESDDGSSGTMMRRTTVENTAQKSAEPYTQPSWDFSRPHKPSSSSSTSLERSKSSRSKVSGGDEQTSLIVGEAPPSKSYDGTATAGTSSSHVSQQVVDSQRCECVIL